MFGFPRSPRSSNVERIDPSEVPVGRYTSAAEIAKAAATSAKDKKPKKPRPGYNYSTEVDS